jgi:hypothetical protein
MEKKIEADAPLGWDDAIDADSNHFETLPDNTACSFVVQKLEKTRTADGKKPMAKVELLCEGLAGEGTTYVRENLVLSTRAAWKIGEFFRAIGQRKHGESIVPNWDAVVGATGQLVVAVENWTGKEGDARTNNKVKRFLDPPEGAATAEDMSVPPETADEGVSFT